MTHNSGRQRSPQRSSPQRSRSRSRSRSPQKRVDQSLSSSNDHKIADQSDTSYNERYVGSVRSHKIAKMRRAQSQEQLTNTRMNSDEKINQSLKSVHEKSHMMAPRRHRSDVDGYAYPRARTAATQKSSAVHSVSNTALNTQHGCIHNS